MFVSYVYFFLTSDINFSHEANLPFSVVCIDLNKICLYYPGLSAFVCDIVVTTNQPQVTTAMTLYSLDIETTYLLCKIYLKSNDKYRPQHQEPQQPLR